MTTQIYYASTAFGLATLSAALADGAFPPADRRVLVLSNNAGIPETAYGAVDVAGIGPLLEAFDDVYPYNAAVAPQHPSLWQPRAADLPIWERALRSLWSLDGDLHLVVESIQVSPALALCQTFADAVIDVYADGLMSYGPSRNPIPAQVGARVQRVLHLDLVPGVRPLLLREYGVPPVTISTESFHKVIAAVGAEAGPPALGGTGPTAVLLGQYLSALDLLTEEEERQLHLEMVEGSVAAGYLDLVFKAHPGAPAGLTGPLAARARELGARLTVREDPQLVETWYAAGEVGLVVGCFSTALVTASLYGVPPARVGTELMLKRLNPYENANRIPATIVAATLPRLDRLRGPVPDEDEIPAQQLVDTVGFLMQPSRNPDLRNTAVALLEQRPEQLRPFVRRKRLATLELPDGRTGPGPARRRRVRQLADRVLGRGLSDRLARLARRVRTRATPR